MRLEELISICTNNRKEICFVGGGGKTTLMYLLADRISATGMKVLVATTTHIIKPNSCYAVNADEVRSLWSDGCYAVVGEVDKANSDKLIFPKEELYNDLKREADVILLEADGARRLPCKIPAKYEPVISDDCDCVIGVMGMSAMGKKLRDCCFRYREEGTWLGTSPESVMTVDIAVKLLSSEYGSRKSVGSREYYVVLNQCDNEKLQYEADRIAEKLSDSYGIKAVCCQLRQI